MRTSCEYENLITKLNYNENAKGIFGMLLFGSLGVLLYPIDRGEFGKQIPEFLRGHVFDAFGGAGWSAFYKSATGSPNRRNNALGGVLITSVQEVLQGVSPQTVGGYFDWGDFLAYAVGAAVWASYDAAAKALYDSRLPVLNTLWIYKLAGIQDRRL